LGCALYDALDRAGLVAEAEPVGEGGGFDAAGDAELGHDVGHVHAGGLGRDEQFGCDVAVGAADDEEAQHL